jgi:pyruvate dehydrogenase E2 component (dihydrolipoamide acetyltransferase)
MSGMRKVIARRMSESWHTSPAVTLDISVDMTTLAGMREGLKAEGAKASYTDFLIYIVSRTLLAHPILNCTIDGDNILYRNYVNMGVAVALPDGLLVPVIKDAHVKGLSEISKELASLAERARGNSLSTDDLRGGTFTITNLGMFGIESFSPIINQPEVAILGVNAIRETIVPASGGFVVKPLLKLSLTTDHRAVDGAVAAQFLSDLRKRIENPALLML